VRIDLPVIAPYGGLPAAWPQAVTAVAPIAPADSSVARAAVASPEVLEAARRMALGIVRAPLDSAGLTLRGRQALSAYSSVRDGDSRDYYRRVLGFEARA
jgi:hypothetical protein